ncbi:MAG: hypothetical protein ACYC26_07400 [Phycisphaerales bacterium]
MRKHLTRIVGGLVVVLCVAHAQAQSFVTLDGIPAGLNQPMRRVDLRGVPAVDALAWWAQASGVNLVVSWNELSAEGYDPQSLVVLQLREVSARTVLKLLMTQIFNSNEVLAEVSKQYIRIRTRQHANNDLSVKIYTIGDLIHSVPNFKGPSMDLTQILSDRENNSSSSIFAKSTEIDEEQPTTKSQRAQMLIDSIQRIIYPDVWDAKGGNSSIRYYEGRLIVTAPQYVHERIGIPDSIDLTVNSMTYSLPHNWNSNNAGTYQPGPIYRGYNYTFTSGVAGVRASTEAATSLYHTNDSAYYAQPYHRRAVFGGSNGVAGVRPAY